MSGLTLMIDNYDSFTYNIVQYLQELGANVVTHRNDQITLEECIALQPARVVISPGPGSPKDAGISKDVILHFAGRLPVLGVCLGHQSIIECYGGNIIRASSIMHGKVSRVWHDGRGVYLNVPDRPAQAKTITPSPASSPASAAPPTPMAAASLAPTPAFPHSFLATRYHSLIGEAKTLPSCLTVTSFIEESDKSRTIMGVRHERYTVEGVQYHPESVTTENGKLLLENFLQVKGGEWKDAYLQS